jgi:hypothetical protein
MRLLTGRQVSGHILRISAFLAPILLAALLLGLAPSAPAFAADKHAAVGDVTPAPDDDEADDGSGGKGSAPTNDNVCDITGVVNKLQNVERSPWTDGTPSTLNTTEIDISVAVKDRRPHDKNTAAGSCKAAAAGEVHTYKLCSPTQVKAGDNIHAVEGLRTGPAHAASCLFDLTVDAPANGHI